MTEYDGFRVEREDASGVVTITLDVPDKLNRLPLAARLPHQVAHHLVPVERLRHGADPRAAYLDRWFEPMPHKSIGMREDYGPVWSPDGTHMAAIVDGLLTMWPVAPDGTQYVVWNEGLNVTLATSRDGGRTFEPSRPIFDVGPPYFGGAAGIHEFTDLRWLSVQTATRHYPF